MYFEVNESYELLNFLQQKDLLQSGLFFKYYKIVLLYIEVVYLE